MTISESNELIFLYSLNRHLRENHKGVRPYACTLCDKKYGRRDYLQRHLKSHNANYAVNLQSASHINASQVVQKVQVQPQNTKSNTIILQQGQGGAIQVCKSNQRIFTKKNCQILKVAIFRQIAMFVLIF